MDLFATILSQISNITGSYDQLSPVTQTSGSWVEFLPDLEMIHMEGDLTAGATCSYYHSAADRGLNCAHYVTKKMTTHLDWATFRESGNETLAGHVQGSNHSIIDSWGLPNWTNTISLLGAGVASHSVAIGILIVGALVVGGCFCKRSQYRNQGPTVDATKSDPKPSHPDQDLDLDRIEELRNMIIN